MRRHITDLRLYVLALAALLVLTAVVLTASAASAGDSHPSTTTTLATLPPPDTPTIVWVDATWRQECPSATHPAGLLEVTVSGTRGTTVDVMGRTVIVPGTATFDLPAQGFIWTVYVDWDGGTRTLTDYAPTCPAAEPPPPADPFDDEVSVHPDPSPERLPVTGANTARALVGAGAVVAGGVALAVSRHHDD